jgi:16S rRNA processing protein RimM
LEPFEDHVLIGKITGAHGLKGVLKIVSYADSPSLFESGASIIVKATGKPALELTVKWAKPHSKTIRIAFEEVNDRNEAEALRGAGLYILREWLPQLEAGTYYWFDLMGLSVYTGEGRYLGQIESIVPTGSNDVYVVVDHQAETGRREILIPALTSVVMAVDLDQGRMTVDLPEGL